MPRRFVTAPVTNLLLSACSAGTEGARPGQGRTHSAASDAGTAQQGTPPHAARLACRTAPEQLTRDWNRVLVARGRDYFPARLGLFTRDIDELIHTQPVCPGHQALRALRMAAANLATTAGGSDSETMRGVTLAGNRWLDATDGAQRFAPP